MFTHIPWFKKGTFQQQIHLTKNSAQKIYLEAANTLRKRREEHGISLSELALRTKITKPVLEAIENCWQHALPEEAYLFSMLRILEIELNLEKNSLDGILKVKEQTSEKKTTERFTPGSINNLQTWQGSLLYILLICSSIFCLNQLQRQLARVNSQTFQPIAPSIDSLPIPQRKTSPEAVNNGSTKENINIIGPQSNWFISILKKFPRANNLTLIEIDLSQQSKLSIESGNGYQATFNKAQGDIKLKLLAPVIVHIQPKPTIKDKIIWKGKKYLLGEMTNIPYTFN